jgi:hypothetical protein
MTAFNPENSKVVDIFSLKKESEEKLFEQINNKRLRLLLVCERVEREKIRWGVHFFFFFIKEFFFVFDYLYTSCFFLHF